MSIVAANEGVREEDTVAQIRKCARRRHYSAAGRDNTRVLSLLLDRADLFIGNNSGPAHLSGQLGRRTLVLWGPSDPKQWSPIGPEVEPAMDVRGLDCFPCSPSGCDKPVCMDRFTVDVAMESIERRRPGLPTAIAGTACAGNRRGRTPSRGTSISIGASWPKWISPGTWCAFRWPGKIRQFHAQHIIEHFPINEIERIVRCWSRPFAPGGAIVVVTPNLGYIAHGYVTGAVGTREAVMRLYGEQNYPGNFHYNLFDRDSL